MQGRGKQISKKLNEWKNSVAQLENLFKSYKYQPPYIYWTTLEAVPVGSKVDIAEGVYSIKRSQTKLDQVYTTFFEPNSVIDGHLHDCVEYISVIDGIFVDLIEEINIIPGDVYPIKAWCNHEIICISPDGGVLDVKFIKNFGHHGERKDSDISVVRRGRSVATT